MSHTTRHDLLLGKSAFNQMRNLVYHLQRFMQSQNCNTEDVKKRCLSMGQNIGATFAQEISPKGTNPTELLPELYSLTMTSKVKITQDGAKILVADEKCPLCKYQYSDIKIPGCTITVGMISELLVRNGYVVKNSGVKKSKTLGDSECVHEFEIVKK